MIFSGEFFNRSEQETPARIRQKLKELTHQKTKWDYDTLKQVVILSSRIKEYVPTDAIPEKIDLGNLQTHIRKLSNYSIQDGNEYSQTFLADIKQSRLLTGRLIRGRQTSVRYDWTKQPGQYFNQFGVIGMHVHPRQFLSNKGINPFSPDDFISFILTQDQMLDIVIMGDHVIASLKTSTTQRKPDREQVKKRIADISKKYSISFGKNNRMWLSWDGSMKNAIRANKEIHLEFGLQYYLGRIGELIKRVELVKK